MPKSESAPKSGSSQTRPASGCQRLVQDEEVDRGANEETGDEATARTGRSGRPLTAAHIHSVTGCRWLIRETCQRTFYLCGRLPPAREKRERPPAVATAITSRDPLPVRRSGCEAETRSS